MNWLYFKYCFKLRIFRKMFDYPSEWAYDYSSLSKQDILAIMATCLSNCEGNVQQFDKRWPILKNTHFKGKNLDDIESYFRSKLNLNLPQGL